MLTLSCSWLHRNTLYRHLKLMRSSHVTSLKQPQHVCGRCSLDCLITWELLCAQWGFCVHTCKCHLLILIAGPSLFCDGVCERRRSHVPHPEVQEVRRRQSPFLHSRDHLCSHVPAQQRHHLQV